MKKALFAGMMSLLLAQFVSGQAPLTGYTNFGNVTSPPVIDATNFVNLGIFNFVTPSSLPFDFSDVRTFTNRNAMADDTGWRFDTAVPNQFGNPTRSPALVFANMNP